MKQLIRYTLGIGIVFSVLSFVWGARPVAEGNTYLSEAIVPASAPSPVDSDSLHYPFHDRHTDKYNDDGSKSPLYMKDPSNISDSVDYDPKENQYNISEHMGSLFYRNPSYMTFEEFRDREFDHSTRQYWRQRANEEDQLQKKAFAPKIIINSEAFERIFGTNTIDIRPQGSAELIFALNNSKNLNPALPVRQRSITTFDFKEKIQMNVTANIGDKMKLAMNYNTEATFEFENKMKLEYTGHEDDIIKKIEAGNVTLPLNSQLIQGSQSLFGIKTQLQFGRMMVTSVFSQQKGKSQTINVQGGAQTTQFDIKGDQYEANRHFFLSQYFRNQYETALKDINQIRSSINITRIEVWVQNTTTTRANDATRNLITIADIGEVNNIPNSLAGGNGGPPDNNANNLFNVLRAMPYFDSIRTNTTIANNDLALIPGFVGGRNYKFQQNARLLQPTEYTVNNLLGYISLNSELASNQILAVAYEYTLNGQVYHVGELSTTSGEAGSKALFVKLLRSTTIDPSFFTWDLMMKNIYNLGGYQIKPDQFRLDVLYQDDAIGSYINYIPEGCKQVNRVPLLRVLGLDKLNTNGDPQKDGVFDWREGITINSANGRIIFPVLEPFGSSLKNQFCFPQDAGIVNKYLFQELYDTTRVIAQQHAEKNKFTLHGSYQSQAGNDIPLNAVNVPQGSVKVTAGGVPLKENVDYTVDYTLGRVKIINEAYLKSNTPIQISLESQSLFNIQTKTMWGSRFDYTFNKDLQVGATILHLTERPITQKVNYGDEPISNTVMGTDATYRTDSRMLTNLLNNLPLYHTKEISTLTLSGEVAKLFPGHSNAIGAAGTSYIDDFEGAITPYDIKNPGQWMLASTPHSQHDIFPEDYDSLINGYNRARLAWYYVDNIFQSQNNGTPPNITVDQMSNNFVRDIQETEIFPNKSSPYGPRSLICTNLAFYPTERGPYNYDVFPLSGISSGVDSANGSLLNPRSRWGGIMRRIETTNFQDANIEFLQFWMMDPFAYESPNDGTGGDLYVNLGDVSEDILRDGHKCFENGLFDPTGANPPKATIWGKYPDENLPQIGYNFDFDPGNRAKQDIGLDGLNDGDERTFFNQFLTALAARTGAASAAYAAVNLDPSNDDWAYFQSLTYNSNNVGPLERYKKVNGMEGNSPTSLVDGFTALGSQYPDFEDLNKDFTMQTDENYFQYRLKLIPSKMQIGQNYITDIVETDVRNLPNNATGRTIKWYQIKIPINEPQKIIGSPNLTNVAAIRMFVRNYSSPVILRFAKMEFLRDEWRKYNATLLSPGELEPIPDYPGNTTFDLSYVNIEENSSRQPVNYVLPPGIERVRDVSTTQLAVLNEQSLSLKACNLKDGDARACYKTTQLDIRSYKKLQMYIHAESDASSPQLRDGDLTCFIRLGGDFVDNYYEYEVPLVITAPHDNDPDHVWPTQNNLEINLDDLVGLKTARNNAMAGDPLHNNLLTPFSKTIQSPTGSTVRIQVMGSPSLSNVRTIMIGIRNPKDPGGQDKCGEVWVNELRLSEFDEKGGWAATGRVQAKLADLGNATLVGNHSTVGWGSIEKRVNERDKADKTSYDISTNLELGKFLPEKTGIKIPMFFEYAEQRINPQYDPLDPDVVFVQSLENAPNPAAVKAQSQDFTERKSINFTNVKKTKTGKNKKSHIYDVENFNATYAYTEISHNDYNIEHSIAITHQGILGYNFNNAPKPVQPFSKVNFLNSPFLRLIKDFNFYYAPSSISVRGSIMRTYSESLLRNNTGFSDFIIEPTFVKSFRMLRNYQLNWDLTKSIKFDFTADAAATIDEPAGRVDTREAKDSIIHNLKALGRLTHYHHAGNLTYNIPLSKIPLVDWVSANAKYSFDYSWTTGALTLLDTAHDIYGINSFKNTIQNSRTIGGGVNLNLTTLYNKVPYLKKLSQPPPPKPVQTKKPPKPKMPLDSAAKARLKLEQDSIKKNRPGPLAPVFKGIASLLTSVKTASVTYSETDGTLLPGFDPRPYLLGTNFNYQNDGLPGSPRTNAPGWEFILGSQRDVYQGKPYQHRAIIDDAAKYHWLTADTSLNIAYSWTKLQNLSGRIALEPVKSLKVDVTFSRNYSLMHSSYWHINPEKGEYNEYSPTESGNFSISYLTWNTHFVNDQPDYVNSNFQNFSAYRIAASQFLAARNPHSSGRDTLGYKDGYGPTQQEVLTSAFIAAYTGKSPSAKSVFNSDQFPKIPMPNWRITYDGLSKLPVFQSFLQSFNLSHGYRSTYSVNSFSQNLLPLNENDYSQIRDTVGNILPRYNIAQVSISEQLAPLIGVDMTFKNTLQARFEIKRDRTVGLTYANTQVTEVRGWEYVFGTGYKIKKFKPPFIKLAPSKLNNDLNLKADFSWRKNTTLLRKLIENANQPSAGSTSISVKVSADYNINERFNVKLFADKTINNPFVSTSFPTSNLNAGFSLRFTLAQ